MSDHRRIEAVEAKLAHQEILVGELSDVIYRQQLQIEQLERKGDELVRRVRELLALSDDQQGDDPLPPHY